MPFNLDENTRSQIAEMAKRYGLAYELNCGGAEFYRDGFKCQTGCCDYVTDLETLRKAILEAGLCPSA